MATKLDRNPFDVKDFIDPYSGEIVRKYFYKRKPCNRVTIKSKIADQLAGYALIEKDLRSCLVWIDEIDRRHDERPKDEKQRFGQGKNRDNYLIIKGLFVSILTFYGKCFAACEGRRVKLEKNKLDPEFHKAHDEAISYRNNFAAHSGAAKLERVKVAAVFPDPKNDHLPIRIYTELDQPDVYWPNGANDVSLRDLIEHVRKIVLEKVEQLYEKISREDAKNSIQEWINKKTKG